MNETKKKLAATESEIEVKLTDLEDSQEVKVSFNLMLTSSSDKDLFISYF